MMLNKIYFPHLNGIRFIAAFLVIVHHIEQLKSIFKLPSLWGGAGLLSRFISVIGPQGVVLFFVLSGFLITYLLLAEEAKSSTISVKKFYVRRILRIWPLYLLIVVLSLFVFPYFNLLTLPGFGIDVVQDQLWLKLLLYLFFFANLVLALLGIVPYASQTWSIGTEEQFYLVWPVIVKQVKKYRLLLMVVIVVLYNLVRFYLASPISDGLPYKAIIRAFWGGFTIDCMAIGGFFAVLLFQKQVLLKWFLNNTVFYLSLVAVVTAWALGIYIPYFNAIFYAGLYGIILLNFAAGENIRINLENSVFNYLGNISYGLYMLHPIAITLAIRFAMHYGLVSNWIIYPLTLLLTVGLSALSYHYYERYFLRFKSRFAVVESGAGK